MCFEEFIKCPQGTSGLTWDEMLIYDDVVAVNAVLLTPNSKEVWLKILLVADVLFQTGA